MSRTPKAKDQAAHARRQALLRYDEYLTQDVEWQLLKQIRSTPPKAVFVEKQSNRISVWMVWAWGTWVPVVYDKRIGQLATVLAQPEAGLISLGPMRKVGVPDECWEEPEWARKEASNS